METEILNYTGRDINLFTSSGNILIPVSGGEIKATLFREVGDVIEFKGKRINLGDTEISGENINLPPKIDGIIYIVTSIIFQMYWRERDDFYTVDEPVKEVGKIIGFKSITRSNINVLLRDELSKKVDAMYKFYNEMNIVSANKDELCMEDFVLEIKELISKI